MPALAKDHLLVKQPVIQTRLLKKLLEHDIVALCGISVDKAGKALQHLWGAVCLINLP